MKKIVVILMTAFVLTACNNTEDTQTAEVENMDTLVDVSIVDYDTMNFEDQEADLDKRIASLRAYESNVTESEREKYRLEVDNLENEIILFKEKRAAVAKEPKNDTMQKEARTLGDQIRAKTDKLKLAVQKEADDMKNELDKAAYDAKEAAQDIEEVVEDMAQDVKEESTKIKESLKNEKQKVFVAGTFSKQHENTKFELDLEASNAHFNEIRNSLSDYLAMVI